jgi:Spy/CpxP family protein refolding chaperone
MKRTTPALAALAFIAGITLAQPGPGCTGGGQCQQMKVIKKVEMQAMPEMTPEQLDKMDALRMSHIKEMMPLKTDLRIKEMELAALWRAEKLDAKKIVAKVKELSDLRGKMQLAKVNHHLDVYNQLTPEQRKAWRPPMMGGRGKMRGMGRRMMRRAMMDEDMGGPMGCGPEGPGRCYPQGGGECPMQ